MTKFAFSVLAIAFCAFGSPSSQAAPRYKVNAIAVCASCGDNTPIPLETTGQGFSTRAACEKSKRELVVTFKRNGFRVRARCVLNRR